MAEEQAPSPEDTPNPQAAEQADHAAQPDTTNWEERYKEFQSGVTPKLQELAQLKEREDELQWLDALESDPDTQTAALKDLAKRLGYQLEGEPEVNPTDALEQRIARMEESQNAASQQAQEAQIIDDIDRFVTNELTGLATGEGRKFTEREEKIILSHAVSAFPPDEDTGMPQVGAAYEEIKGLLDDSRQRWVQSKKAPTVPQPGSAGSEKVDLTDDEARIAHTARYFEAARDAGQ